MKLWQKENTSVSEIIESFTVGKDREFDMELAAYDVEGSIAHVEMLSTVGLMTVEEANACIKELKNIGSEIQAGQFEIQDGVEDVHSQIELLLTKRIGDSGKKIHSGRSRND